MKEITFGRDEETQKLFVSYLGETKMIDSYQHVPQSVSRHHCVLRIQDDGTMTLENLNSDNFTFVNHVAIEKKTIVPIDLIELGRDCFVVDVKTIITNLPPTADISHLEKVWKEYDESLFELTVRERRFNAYRNGIGIFTMAALVLGVLFGRQSNNYIYIGMYVIAIVLSLIFFAISLREASKIPQKRKDITNRFQEQYVCPQCGRNLGGLGKYELLRQNDNCPYCKVKFIH